MAHLIGVARLGRDAEIRHTAKGDAVSGLSLAFDYRNGTEKATQWVDGSLWGRTAEALAPYLIKGKQLYVVVDDLHMEEFESKGLTRSKLVGRISKIDLVGGAGEGGGAAESRPAARPAAPARPAAKPAAQASAFDGMDEDIPF